MLDLPALGQGCARPGIKDRFRADRSRRTCSDAPYKCRTLPSTSRVKTVIVECWLPRLSSLAKSLVKVLLPQLRSRRRCLAFLKDVILICQGAGWQRATHFRCLLALSH